VAIHIGEISSDVTAAAGDAPLSEAQIERLVRTVIHRLEDKLRNERGNREATQISRSVAPAMRPRT
jgi:hypothetical protein